MKPNPEIMQAVEQLQYRVTLADVATQSGLELNIAQQGLLALATDVNAHLQVVETGDVIYQFPNNFRTILRNRSWRMRLEEWGQKLWQALFYLIRISFGILLILSIVVIFLTIAIIVIGWSLKGDDSDQNSGRGGDFRMPNLWLMPDFRWIFYQDYDMSHSRRRSARGASSTEQSPYNFLEGIFSFLFGDGNPNTNLEERRWQIIAGVIRQNKGAVVAEQITPYLDTVKSGSDGIEEDYMIPVLSRFNGYPEVSPDGQLVYRFPELQTTVVETRDRKIAPYLQEARWVFSQASSGQKIGAIALGGVNLVGALILGSLLQDGELALEIGGLVAFVQSIYWLLLGYGAAFLLIPLIRYGWLQRRNRRMENRNAQRQRRATQLQQLKPDLRAKLAYAQQFQSQVNLDQQNLVYTTEQDLLTQEVEQREAITAAWEQRLQQSESDSEP